MKAPKNTSGGDFEKHPEGWALVVCTRIVDLGTHFNEAKKKDERKIMIGFESEKKITEEGDFQGKPFLLYATFNYSMYQNSHLCQFIESWFGKKFESQDQADNFDLSKLLRHRAFANITHNGKYVNIQTIGPVPEGMTPPQPEGHVILVDQDDLDMNQVLLLSDNLQKRVMGAQERNTEGSTAVPAQGADERNPPPAQPPVDDFDDDIPF